MTGWQGNDGGQGGGNPQPFGPDPGTNQYGADPYGQGANQYGPGPGPYGGNPYGDNPYAQPDPYAQYQQPGYQTGGFPAQGYPPTSGFPVPGYPPPPPRRSKLPIILSLVAIVIIIGAVVTIVLVNRTDSPTATPPPESSSSKPGPTSETKSGTSTSEEDPPTTGGGTHEDWTTIDNSADAGLTYQVPPDWKKSTTARQSGLDVDFTGAADFGLYNCGGGGYVRTFAASGDVQSKDGKDLDLAATMTDFAKSFTTTYYGPDAKADVPAPKAAEVDGATAMTLTAAITPTVTKPDCQATSGEVAMIGVLLESEGEPDGVAMLVVVNDLEGGPDEPAPLAPTVTQEILKTVSVG